MNRRQRALPTREQVERTRRKMYETIIEYCEEHNGNFPTYRDLCDLCDIPSTSTVGGHLEALVKEGLIERRNCRLMVAGSKWIAPTDKQGMATV